MNGSKIDALRIADAATVISVHRTGSMAKAARELGVTASQVTKAVARLEEQVQVLLFDRSARGLVLTDAGQRLLPALRSLVDAARQLVAERGENAAHVTIAAPSFLFATYLPIVAETLAPKPIRALEGSRAFIRSHAAENLFEIAFTHAEERLPAHWVSERIGMFREGLFATPKLARDLGPKPSIAALRRTPFVIPVHVVNGELFRGQDDCPLPMDDRARGHEVSTFGAALEMASRTDQLAFGPIALARRYVEAKRLVEIEVEEWNVTAPLLLHVDAERVNAPLLKNLVAALRKAVEKE